MTAWDDILPPAPVYCDGCTLRIHAGERTHGEHLQTPIGRCHRVTHDRPACIDASRYAVGGQPVKVRETTQDKVNTRIREG